VNLSWTATDADNDPLRWDVTWGDGTVSACSSNCGNQYPVAHTWNQAGTYKVEARAYDGKGWSQPHSFTVEVLPVAQKLFSAYKCGDMNGDDLINQTDLDLLTGYAFDGVPIPAGLKVDLNGDGYPDILDVTVLNNYLKRGGPAPTCGAGSSGGGGTKTTPLLSPAASVINSIENQLNSISQTLNNLLNQLGM